MARKMRKFSAGGAQGKYDRRMADIEKDRKIALAKGRNADVVEAKAAQRKADAEDDRAKRMGTDRTATRKAEYDAEQRLSRTRRFGADKPAAAAEPAKASAPAAAATPEVAKAKPQTTRQEFNAAFSAARAKAVKEGRDPNKEIFMFGKDKIVARMSGAGASSSRTNNSASTAGSSTNNSAAKNNPPAGAPTGASTVAILLATKAAREKAAKPEDTPKAAPAAKSYETPAQAAARVAKLTGSPKARNNLAGAFGIDSVSNAKARASLLATREAEKARNAERAKGNTPLIRVGQDAANDPARKAKLATLKKAAEAPGATGYDKDRYKRAVSSDMVGVAKGGKIMKKYAAGGVTKEMPSSKAMGSLGMAKGGKAKMKPAAKGKDKGNPFAATKFGTAMMKKSADTEGRAMKKFAVGGSTSNATAAQRPAASAVQKPAASAVQKPAAQTPARPHPVYAHAAKLKQLHDSGRAAGMLAKSKQDRINRLAKATAAINSRSAAAQRPAATAVQRPAAAASAVQKPVMPVRKGGKIEKKAKGGSIDGCAVRGKTKGRMMAMGGMTGYKKGGKTC